MEENTDAAAKYAGCAGVKRKQPSAYFDEAVTKKIITDYRTLPLLERRLYEYLRVRHYSLLTNRRLLACRWRVHYERYHEKQRPPFQFPKVDDYHFYNYQTRYIPSQSISNAEHHRLRLGIAPIDVRRQLPTPSDMHLRNTTRRKRLLNV